jgi:hypothetical protein
MRGDAEGSLGGTYGSDGQYYRLIVSEPEAPGPDLERQSEEAGATFIEVPGVGDAAILCDDFEGSEQGGSLTWLAGDRRVQLRLFPTETAECDPTGSLDQPLVRQAMNMQKATDAEVETFMRDHSS